MYGALSAPVRVVATSLVVIGMSACATPAPPNPIAAAPAQARSVGIATLAFGAWEQELAPAVTRAEVVARLAEQQYKGGRISAGTKQSIYDALVRARAALTLARRGNRATPTPENRAALTEAVRLTDLAASLLEP